MKNFKDYINESNNIKFDKVFGKQKDTKTHYTMEVIFKTFVTKEDAIEIFKELGIDTEPSWNQVYGGGGLLANFPNADSIKPSKVSDLKFHPSVSKVQRFKV